MFPVNSRGVANPSLVFDPESSQAPMRERLDGREGCVSLAMFLAVSVSTSTSLDYCHLTFYAFLCRSTLDASGIQRRLLLV